IASVNGAIISFHSVLVITKVIWLMMTSVVLWFFYLLMQLLTSWIPYLTGQHLIQFPRTLYDTHVRETIKLLPPIKDHIIPDAQHNVLQILSLITLIVRMLAARRGWAAGAVLESRIKPTSHSIDARVSMNL